LTSFCKKLVSFSFFSKIEIRRIKCNADERCRRLLEVAAQ